MSKKDKCYAAIEKIFNTSKVIKAESDNGYDVFFSDKVVHGKLMYNNLKREIYEDDNVKLSAIFVYNTSRDSITKIDFELINKLPRGYDFFFELLKCTSGDTTEDYGLELVMVHLYKYDFTEVEHQNRKREKIQKCSFSNLKISKNVFGVFFNIFKDLPDDITNIEHKFNEQIPDTKGGSIIVGI